MTLTGVPDSHDQLHDNPVHFGLKPGREMFGRESDIRPGFATIALEPPVHITGEQIRLPHNPVMWDPAKRSASSVFTVMASELTEVSGEAGSQENH